MLVKGRLEPDIAQLAPAEPLGREPLHFGDHRLGVDVGSAEQFERARCPPALAERCALDHHGAEADKLDFATDTIGGLQLNAAWNQQLDAVVQAVTRLNSNNN